MSAQRTLLLPLSFLLFTAAASADPVVYAVAVNYNNFTGQFGTMSLTTGVFNPIGPVMSDPLGGLVPGPNGNLLGVSSSGNLDSINPATGQVSVIGATGLGNFAYTTAELNGTVYAMDLNSNLYRVNTTTGVASLIGYTGIPICPSLVDPNDVSDEALFAAGGKLYATFDGVNLNTLAIVDSPELYQINPATGVATLVGATTLGLDAALSLNGTVYAYAADYNPAPDTLVALNLANGNTTFLTNSNLIGPYMSIVGEAATPEPASFSLIAIGIAAALVAGRRTFYRRQR